MSRSLTPPMQNPIWHHNRCTCQYRYQIKRGYKEKQTRKIYHLLLCMMYLQYAYPRA